MIPCAVLVLFPALCLPVALSQPSGPPTFEGYSPAIERLDESSDVGWLEVFAHRTEDVLVPLPLMRSWFYGPGGKSLYGQPMEAGACLYRVEFNPTRTTAVSCPPGLSFQSASVSATRDKLVFSGRLGQAGNWTCGVFEVPLPNGEPRPILTVECPASHLPWDSLSLSPDGKRVVAIYSKGLARPKPFPPYTLVVIELNSGRTRSVGVGYLKAAWSPDGRWIAALESGGTNRTELFNAASFVRVKALPNSEVEWSPDSHYLLRVGGCASSEAGTIEALNIRNGAKIVFPSSKCDVDNISTGWVSNDILPPKGAR